MWQCFIAVHWITKRLYYAYLSWRWPRCYSWPPVPTSFALFTRGIYDIVRSLISLCEYMRAKQTCAQGKSMIVHATKMKISKYRESRPARCIENPGIIHPPSYKLGVLWAKLEVYAFGSSWKKHDGTDKKKSPHIIEDPSCALYAAWKFHSSSSLQYSAIKLRLLFAAFSDTLLYRWQRQDKSGEGKIASVYFVYNF